MRTYMSLVLSLFLLLVLQSGIVAPTQAPYRVETTGNMSDDAAYRPLLKHRAFTRNGPTVLLDEGHGATEFDGGFYRLATADGYRIQRLRDTLTPDLLRKANILVIMGPGVKGALQSPMAPAPAFTDEEAKAVREWIENGGALLFALNGFAAGPHSVLSRLGIEFNLGAVTDPEIPRETDQNGSGGYIFSGEKLLSSSHKIFLGRSSAEQVRTVILKGMTPIRTMPEEAETLLQCSGNAQFYPDFRQVQAAAKAKGSTQHSSGPIPDPHAAIAIAYSLGKGRVVVLGDVFISAGVFYSTENPRSGVYQGLRQGDNQQFTLNVMHWLSGLL